MNCREFTEFLYNYLVAELPAEARAEFEEHLAECPWCVAYLHSYRKTIRLGQAAFSPSVDGPLPAEVPERLVQAVRRAWFRSA